MDNPYVGLALAHLFLYAVGWTFALVARWRRWFWRPHYRHGIYVVMLPAALVLFGVVGGDRGFALIAILAAVAGLALLLAGRPQANPQGSPQENLRENLQENPRT